MDVRPILLSFQTAIIAILFTFVLGTGVAYIVFRLKNRKLKILLNSLFTLPLVLPPTVFGFFLLTIFGSNVQVWLPCRIHLQVVILTFQ